MSGRVGVGTLRGVVGVRSVPTEAWVTAPYGVGMPAVWLDDDPEGMRVHRTAVLAVRPEGDGWSVETAAGIEHVDAYGEGSRLVPVDEELAAEFEEGGTSFVVLSTVDELEQDLDQSLDWQRFERDLGRDEVDRDYGPER
jgi:hypothetical protein